MTDYGWVIGPVMIVAASYGVYLWVCAAERNWAARNWPDCPRCRHPLTMLVRPGAKIVYRCLGCPPEGTT